VARRRTSPARRLASEAAALQNGALKGGQVARASGGNLGLAGRLALLAVEKAWRPAVARELARHCKVAHLLCQGVGPEGQRGRARREAVLGSQVAHNGPGLHQLQAVNLQQGALVEEALGAYGVHVARADEVRLSVLEVGGGEGVAHALAVAAPLEVSKVGDGHLQ
jgi:hypothetical protein